MGDDRRSRETLFKIALVHHLAFDYPSAEAAYDEAGMPEVLALLAAEAAVPYDSTQTTSPIRTQSNIARA